MNKILLIGFILMGALQMNAQDSDGHRERIKALKTAYITEGLNLSAEEAEKFWPVYNKFDRARRELHRRENADIDEIECISEEQASKIVQEFVQIEREDYLLKKKFFEELQSIISARRIVQLQEVEEDFNRKLLREYRERRRQNNE